MSFEANLKALEAARPRLMVEHASEWVVIADGLVAAFAPDFQSVATLAFSLFPDGRSLVAPVDERFELREPIVLQLGARLR